MTVHSSAWLCGLNACAITAVYMPSTLMVDGLTIYYYPAVPPTVTAMLFVASMGHIIIIGGTKE